jgi:hypothetical protein
MTASADMPMSVGGFDKMSLLADASISEGSLFVVRHVLAPLRRHFLTFLRLKDKGAAAAAKKSLNLLRFWKHWQRVMKTIIWFRG